MIASSHKARWIAGFFYSLFLLFIAAAAYTEQYFLAAIPFCALFFFISWQYKNDVFFLLILSLPFSFEYHFSSGWGTDIPDELLMLFVSVLFVAYAIFKPAAVPARVRQHPVLVLLLLLIGWTAIAVLFSTNKEISLKFLLAKSWYLGAFVLAPLVLFNDEKQIKRTALTLMGSIFVVQLIVLIRHAGTGFSFATTNDAVTPFFRNHVNYSSMLVCMLPVLLAIRYLVDKKTKRLLTGCVILTLIALFFSYARGAWLAMIVGGIAWWMIKRRWLFYSWIVTMALTIGLLWWLKSNDRYLRFAHDYQTTVFHEDFSRHIVSTYQLKDVSTAERFYRWIAGVRMIKDNPLTGSGPNTFYDNYKEYAVPAYKTWVSDNPEHSTVHNYFLLTAVEQGLPGLLFLFLLIGAMLYYVEQLYSRTKDKFYKTAALVVGVMLSMIIALNFLSDLVETDKVGSLFFLCISTLVAIDINTRKKSDPSTHIERIP